MASPSSSSNKFTAFTSNFPTSTGTSSTSGSNSTPFNFLASTTSPAAVTATDTAATSIPPGSFSPTHDVTVTVELGPASSSLSSSTGIDAPGAQRNGISAGGVAGISLGLGLFVGLVAATLFYFWRRPRSSKNGDGEALLGYQHEEKLKHPDAFVAPPAPPPHARIVDWVQRTRPGSVASVETFYSVPESETTVLRSHSIVSSRSAYSQASAARPTRSSEDYRALAEFDGPSRPPHLQRISEHIE
ncbi:hypothetical protein B0H17DRAFT_1132496 [Mycena rosella]|uniref:Uncharacterized protein n=1 Tax=Mycena rosella TaxID=1033263 RepID=A0AAD7DKD2_MYCRO|nr:hypothetical protein B0H17DRAFT_1132496 [Mycena rosella]